MGQFSRDLIGAAVGLCLVPAAALGQAPSPPGDDALSAEEVTRGETVRERRRPEVDPLGIHLGTFFLFPELGLRERYDSNIFATQSGEQADFITTIEPQVRLRSDWNNHALNLLANTQIHRYADNDDENSVDYTFAADGRIDVRRDSKIFLGGGHRLLHEERTSPDDVRGLEPTPYTVTSGNLGGSQRFNRLAVRADGLIDRYRFDNAKTQAGATINNKDRNRDQAEATVRAGYELAPLREVFVRGGYNWRIYDQARDDAGFDRDSKGYEASLGVEYDLTGVTFVEAFAGYRYQDVNDARLPDIGGPGAGLKLIWNVTRLTTVTSGLTRTIEESTAAGASGYFATRFNARVDHELLRNLIVDVHAVYGHNDFRGINRDDNIYGAGFGADYLMNRYLTVSGDYTFSGRESNATNADFDRHVIMLRVTGHL